MSFYNYYYVDLNATSTGHAGTLFDPFSYADFASQLSSSLYEDIYYLKGTATIGSSSAALTNNQGCTITAWDLDEFGPWRLLITDLSKLDTDNVDYKYGIVYVEQDGNLSLSKSFNFENVYFYRKTAASANKIILGVASSPLKTVFFNQSTFISDGSVELVNGGFYKTCVHIEGAITAPSLLPDSQAAMTYCTYNDDSTTITPVSGFSGYFNFEYNQDFFELTPISTISENPLHPSGIDADQEPYTNIEFTLDGKPKVFQQGAFYSNGINEIIYVDLSEGISEGVGTQASPYNSEQFLSLLIPHSDTFKSCIIKLKGMFSTTESFYIEASDKKTVFERWESDTPWGIYSTGTITARGSKIFGGIFKADVDFILPDYLSNSYILANRLVFESYDFNIIKGSSLTSYPEASRIGGCSSPEHIILIDSYFKDSGLADVGTGVEVVFVGLNTAFSQISGDVSSFFDLSAPSTSATLLLSGCGFNVDVPIVAFSTTYDEENYLYPSSIYTVVSHTNTIYTDKDTYSTGLSGESRYGLGAFYFKPLSAFFTATPLSGSTPLSVTFTDDSEGSILSYSWSFGDGNISSLEDSVNVYSSEGIYTVVLKIVGPDDVFDHYSRLAYVFVLDTTLTADFTATPREGTIPLTVTFSDATTGGTPTYWRWNFGDGTIVENESNPSHIYTKPGIYNVSLYVRDSYGVENTVIKDQYILANNVFYNSERTIIQSQKTGSSPSWVRLDTYVSDNFETGSINSYWNSAFDSNFNVYDYNGDLCAASTGSTSFTNTIPASTDLTNDFEFEAGIRIGSDYAYDSSYPSNWAYIGVFFDVDTPAHPSLIGGISYPAYGTNIDITWSSRQPIGYGNPLVTQGTISVPVAAWQLFKIKFVRVGNLVSFWYDLGSGWTQLGSSVTVLGSLNVENLMLQGRDQVSRGYGYSYLNFQCDTGLPSDIDPGKYWRFYVDENLHLIFRYGDHLYKTEDPVAVLDEWMLLEFHPGDNFMYVGTGLNHRKIVPCYRVDIGSVSSVDNDRIYVARNSSMEIDELKMWGREENLTEYYRSLNVRAYTLS